MKIILSILILSSSLFIFAQNKVDSQGRKQGVWYKTYPNSTIAKYKGQFKDDKPYGEFVYHYESGNIQSKIKFTKGGNIAYNTMYHESSGYVMAKGKYVNQEKDSLWLYYDNKGQLKSQEIYKNGKLDGQRVVYYEPFNGEYRVAKFEMYTNGVRNGNFKEYFPNKKIKIEGTFKTGNLDGAVKFYKSTGKIERIERYKHAVQHGWWIFYNDNGTLKSKELFWEGKKLKPGAERDKRAAQLKAAKK